MATLLDIVKKGSTDRSVCIRIIDSGDGTPETGVVYNTSGIDLWYRREGAAVTSITEATLAALTTAHADGGFLHVGNGEYRLDLPDAAFATGANYVDIGGTVTGMIVIGGRVRLVNYDPEDTVRMGLTALPNAAADAAGGLPISDGGGLDLDARLDAAISSRQVALWAAASSTVSLTNTTIANVSAVTSVAALGTGAITAASIATDAIDADALATDAVNEIRNAITGGAYDLDTDANGRIRVVDGTAAGEINTASGVVQAALADGVTHGGTTADVVLRDLSFGGTWNVVGAVVFDNAGNDIRGITPTTASKTGYALSSTGMDAVTLPANLITASSIATDAIGAAELAADAATEIATAVWALATRTLTAATNISGPIADQVWEEAIADHSGTTGSTAEALNAAGAAGDPWTTALPGAYGAGSAGHIIGNLVDLSAADVTAAVWHSLVASNDNTIGSFGEQFAAQYQAVTVDIQSQISALNDISATDVWAAATRTLTAGTNIQLPSNGLANVTAWTVAITGNVTGSLSGSVGSVTGAVGSVTGAVGSVTGNVGGNVTGSVGSVLGGINTTAGVITTLDALDTAQDTQHSTTQGLVTTVNGVIDSVLVDTTQIKADLPTRITKNTELAAFPFTMVLTSDHVTGATSKTVTATRSIDGGAFASCANAVSEIANGWYKITLAAADLNGNTIALRFTATDCDDRVITIVTQP